MIPVDPDADKEITKEPPAEEPEAKARKEQADLANTELENTSKRQDIEARAEYAPKSFWLIILWLPAVYVVVLFQGFHYFGFHLSDTAIGTLIGTTSVNVLGLFGIVARYLFSRSPQR